MEASCLQVLIRVQSRREKLLGLQQGRLHTCRKSPGPGARSACCWRARPPAQGGPSQASSAPAPWDFCAPLRSYILIFIMKIVAR